MDSHELFEEFQQTNRLIRRKIYDQRRQEDDSYSPAQNRLLRKVAQHPGISQKDLAQLLDIRPASLSELTKKMQDKGLLERQQNQQDRRVSNFSLTAAGQVAVEKFDQIRQRSGSEAFSSLSLHDQVELLRILRQLQQHLTE